MQRVKYETNTTGTGALTLTVPTGFQSITGATHPYPTSGACIYTIIDGDGSAWETGYGTISGSTLTRASYAFQSSAGGGGPGFYYSISCSATTPHTVLISRQAYEGHICTASYQDTTGTTFSTASSTTMSLSGDIDGLSYANDAAVGAAVATIVADPMTEFKLARGYRITFTGECDDTSAGDFFGVGVRMNSETKDRVQAWAPLIGTDTLCSCTTPMIRNRPPFIDGETDYLDDGGAVVYTMYNTAGTNITVKPTIYVEWYM